MKIKIYGTKCLNCGEDIPIERNSVKYCSSLCGERYNKKQYKKRNRDKLAEYKRKRKKMGYKQMYKSQMSVLLNRNLIAANSCCLKCGKTESLEIHHIKPRIKGGEHKIGNVMVLCHKCHYDFEQLTRDFWV